MANAGFSAATSPFGTITGLTPKSSNDNTAEQIAEALDQDGNIVAFDEHSKQMSPSCEYAVTGEVTLSSIILGSINTYSSKPVMLTQVQVNTSAGGDPTVTISGVEVETGATADKTCALSGTLSPKAKAQDPAGGFASNTKITQCNTTWSIEPHITMVGGEMKASSATKAKVEVQATMTDYDDAGSFTAGSNFTVTNESKSCPDVDYVTKTATAFKNLTLTSSNS